jgi:hypothetical protein
MRRGVIAYAQILSQLERNEDAMALLDRSFGTEPDPAIDRSASGWSRAKRCPSTSCATPTDGMAEVFFTVATP